MASFLDQLVGTKPVVPNLPVLDLGAEAGKAITANQTNLPGAEKLAGQTNLFNQDQITKMLQAAIPGYSQMTQAAGANIQSELSGQLPQDVQNQIRNATASASVAGGTSGSDFSRNLTARDLGLTSLNLTQQGLASAESWMKTADALYAPSMMNVSSMFISPAQQYQADNEQNQQQFQRDWMANQISAMPSPWATDLKQFVYRAMSAYSGTSVPNNPYSTPGSFGNGGFGGGSGIDSGTGSSGMWGGPSGPESGMGNSSGDYGGEMSAGGGLSSFL